MNALRIWIGAARPKTLPAGICPVVIGSVLAACEGGFDGSIFWQVLVAVLAIQIGTNLINDYCDFVKGADTRDRKGPLRVTQAGLVTLSQMKIAVAVTLSIAALFGIGLAIKGGLLIASLLLISLILAFAYTAGPYPLAYLGLGDPFVFAFFGPIGVFGTDYLHTGVFSLRALLAGIGCGALSTAILSVNNLRDVNEDRIAGKKTVAVRFGTGFVQAEYVACIAAAGVLFPFFSPSISGAFFCALFFFASVPCLRVVFRYRDPSELNRVLGQTGALLFLHTILLCALQRL